MEHNFLVDVFIEIPTGSNIKYEYDNDYKCVRCDRILNTALVYPYNYGFIPNTMSGDGDPLDVLLVTDYKLYPNTVIESKIVGVLLTEDEKGEDHKIIAVPANHVDIRYKDIHNFTDIDNNILTKISHFFENYKKLENNKWVSVSGYKDNLFAYDIYKKSLLDITTNNNDSNNNENNTNVTNNESLHSENTNKENNNS
tara:strand:- start:1284 stop:1877 length:594 start_codon:yes stop_codon:yes gene_type:complete